jgi:type I restriction enzyme M protein
MTEQNQKQLGTTLWAIADQLRGAMDADDFRDYMLVFIFLRYLSDNYETAAQKELGSDYPIKTTPAPPEEGNKQKNSPPLEGWQAKPDGVVLAELRICIAFCTTFMYDK